MGYPLNKLTTKWIGRDGLLFICRRKWSCMVHLETCGIGTRSDQNKNMTSLSRHGLNSSGSARTTLLGLTLLNTGNRLTAIGSSSVGYDSKGRQTSYNFGGASTMSYNALDLPLLYTKGGTSVEWKYSAGGTKLQKKTTSQ